jgi:glycosyltransferase involved in cell wall biosynthesis
MSKDIPIVSVLMTVFNGEEFIKDAMESVINQTFKKWELIIVENHSTDNTRQIINSYNDPRIKNIYLEKTIERTKALNMALKNSTSEFIAILDADDLAEKDRLSIEIDFMQHNLDVGLVCSYAKLIDQEGNVFALWEPPSYPHLLNNNICWSMPICHSTALIRRSIFINELIGYNEEMKIGQDWDLGIRIALNHKIYCIDKVLGSWRRYSTSTTGNPDNFLNGRIETIKILNSAKILLKGRKLKRLNKWQISVNMLAVSLLYFKKNNYLKSFFYFFKSLFLYPAGIIENNYIKKLIWKIDKPLYIKMKNV